MRTVFRDSVVIVDVGAAAALMRGADLFAVGVLAAPSRLQRGQSVSVLVDVDSVAKRAARSELLVSLALDVDDDALVAGVANLHNDNVQVDYDKNEDVKNDGSEQKSGWFRLTFEFQIYFKILIDFYEKKKK